MKHRHFNGEQMADLANLYFHSLNIPIGFLNKVTRNTSLRSQSLHD